MRWVPVTLPARLAALESAQQVVSKRPPEALLTDQTLMLLR